MTADAIRIERPFSCPSCGGIVAPRSAYQRYSTTGCCSAALLLFGCGVWLGIREESGFSILWVLGGALGGGFCGLAVGWLIQRGLHAFFSEATIFEIHAMREYPQTTRELANFLEEIKSADSWRGEWDRRLSMLEMDNSKDEPLVNEGLVAANRLKIELGSGPGEKKKRSRDLDKLTIGGLREELALIARDLRRAAN
jgi:hypothetical protein